ncbi:hypothetical protein F511_02531 [Dorcoceras hygrometricum]|nr:hypothetical protein F511_02531 [Dorcoceras hygrometricum]
MEKSQQTSAYSGGSHEDYADFVTGCSCFRWFSFEQDGGEVEGQRFLLQERGGPQKETVVLAKFKTFTTKIGELRHHMKFTNKRPNQFLYSPETYALNFACEQQEDEDGDLPHSFSSRFASRQLINGQQRRMSVL